MRERRVESHAHPPGRPGPGRREGEQRATPATGRPGWCETSAMIERDPVLAAGAVVMRRRKGVGQVLLVHRPKYDDWAFPKGKLDPGESARTAAVREVLEETGARIRLGPELTDQTYVVGNGTPRTKLVHYWTARVRGDYEPSDYVANEEIDEVDWFDLDVAARVADLRPRPRRARRGPPLAAPQPPARRAPPRPGHLAQAVVRRRDRAAPHRPRQAAGPGAGPRARGVRREAAGVLEQPPVLDHPGALRLGVRPGDRGDRPPHRVPTPPTRRAWPRRSSGCWAWSRPR